jgi:hypothetical protein
MEATAPLYIGVRSAVGHLARIAAGALPAEQREEPLSR